MTAGQMNYFADIAHIAYIAQYTQLAHIALRCVALRRLQQALWRLTVQSVRVID